MIFSTSNYNRLKLRLQRKYQKEFTSTLKNLKQVPPSDLQYWVEDYRPILSGHSSIKWYLLKQIQTYVVIAKALPELSSVPTEFTSKDDVAFEKWNQSEFADVFLKTLNKGKSIKTSSAVALKHLENHIITLGSRFILRENANHLSYRVQTSLGEYKQGKKTSRLLETTLHLEGKDLNLMTHSLKEMKNFSQRIEIALKVIKKFSPSSWERFQAFTDVIIPIRQKEFVSYSHQDLPGYSMINLYDRDFVDLIDDLLHENGHHHLNYYLNLGKVIEEPQDNIYYSPWRRTMRPLRGIYHAYFTFFWAFELFSSLASAKEQDSIFYLFNANEKEKIYWRAVEEFWMLHYSFHDLKLANKHGLISELGWKFILEQNKILQKHKKKVLVWEKKLKAHKPQLVDLKRTLKAAEKHYR